MRAEGPATRWGIVTALVLAAAVPAGAPAAEAPRSLPAGGPREVYEQSLGQPPRVYQPPGGLGHDWAGTPPYVANAATYSDGELIASDTPFDDSGADTQPGNGDGYGAVLSAATLPGVCGGKGATGAEPPLSRHGDHAYASPELRDSADLVELRVAADGDSYNFAALLETMRSDHDAAVRIGVTGPGEPGGAGKGIDAFRHRIEITPKGATVDGAAVASRIDVAGHVLEARVPRSLLPGGTWKLAAEATEVKDGAIGAVTDLAYIPDEPLVGVANCWFELRQSQLIASGEYPALSIDTDRLAEGYTSPPATRTGPMIRLYPPRIGIGQGVTGQARYAQESSYFVYRGLLQPYAAYVAPDLDPARPAPLVMLLHCLNCTHDVYYSSSWPGLKKLADDRKGIIVTPLAYGEGGHYEGEAEWDPFEVLADVSARYAVDRERLYLGGMSMGSLGTMRLGLLYPDLWARTFTIGNYSMPLCVTAAEEATAHCAAAPNYYDVLENARDLPWGMLNGGMDELTPVTLSLEIERRLGELGYAHRLWLHPNRTHDPSLMGQTTDVSSPWLGDARRLANPARVTFKVVRAMDDPGWNVRHDRAYWLSDVRLAKDAASGVVDATSGRGERWTTKPASGNGSDAAGPYAFQGLDPVLATVDEGNTLTLSLRSVASVRVDVPRALLCTGRPLSVKVTSDGPARVDLAGLGALDAAKGTTTETLSDDALAGSCTADRPAPPQLIPRACTSRRAFAIRLREPRGRRAGRLRSARVTVDGRRVAVRRRARRLVAVVDTRGRPPGLVRVDVVGRTTRGRTVRDTRVYRTCARRGA